MEKTGNYLLEITSEISAKEMKKKYNKIKKFAKCTSDPLPCVFYFPFLYLYSFFIEKHHISCEELLAICHIYYCTVYKVKYNQFI